MANKAKIFGVLAVVAVLAAFTFFIFSRTNKYPPSIQMLPDGSVLQLSSISFTNGPASYRGKGVTGWKANLAHFLPRSVVAQLGWPMGAGIMTMGSRGPGTNLTAWTFCQLAGNASFQNVHLQVFDDLGNSFDGGMAMGTMFMFGGPSPYRVNGWVPPAFPRRGKMVGLRYFENIDGTWRPVAEFTFPNPAAGNYPTWTPEAIPATKSDGDLAVTLVELKSGLSKADWARPAASNQVGAVIEELGSWLNHADLAAKSNEVAVTKAVFRISQAGLPTDDWRPLGVEVSDATGNQWESSGGNVSVMHEADSDSIAFDGALWPGETAWKLRYEFTQITNFELDEVFTFGGVPVPGAKDVTLLDDHVNIAGTKLRLVAITGEGAELPGNAKWGTVRNYDNLSIQINPMEVGRHLTLLKITDESGRAAEIHPVFDWIAPERAFAFKPPTGAKTLTFTFVYHQSRFVEFLAKPEFTHPN